MSGPAHPHRQEPLGAGATDRGAQAARQKFALSPAGGAKHPSAQLLARPISLAAGRGGGGRSSTARSPLVQSTTCLGLHLVTGSMVSGFSVRWAGKSAAECCSLSPRLSPARPGRPLKPAWPRSAGHPAVVQAGEARSWTPTHGAAVSAVGCSSSYRRQAAAPTRCSVIQLLLRDHRSCGRTAATSDSRPGLSRQRTLSGRELRARLALLGSCEWRPSPARSPLLVSRRPDPSRQPVPPPAPPSQAARAGKNAERARSSCKVSAPLGAPGIKERAGPSGSNTWEGAGPRPPGLWLLSPAPTPGLHFSFFFEDGGVAAPCVLESRSAAPERSQTSGSRTVRILVNSFFACLVLLSKTCMLSF